MRERCDTIENCGKVGMDKYYESAEWDVKDAYGRWLVLIPNLIVFYCI